MEDIGDLVIAALIGSLITGTVNLLFDYIKKQMKTRRTFIYLVVGAVLGLLTWSLISWFYEETLWTFRESSDGWVYNYDPGDASMSTAWDMTESLRAEFDFGPTSPNNKDARATFLIDNLDQDWTQYRRLKLDVANPTDNPMEITFSIFIDGCFYEFGGYQNLPPRTRQTTVTFNFTEPRYKTCQSPDAFDNPAGSTDHIERLDLILGINIAPDAVNTAKGQINIDNIRLQKGVWYLRIATGAAILLAVLTVAILFYVLSKQAPGPAADKKPAKGKGKERR